MASIQRFWSQTDMQSGDGNPFWVFNYPKWVVKDAALTEYEDLLDVEAALVDGMVRAGRIVLGRLEKLAPIS